MKTGFRKRAMSIVLSATMLIAVLCIAPATAAAETTDDGLTYTVANEEVTITGYTGAGGAVVIPAEIEGKPVTELANGAFAVAANAAAANISSITVPDSVKKMGSSMFNGCTQLTSITLPDEVAIAGSNNMFRGTAITSIKIPSGLTSLGSYCFRDCVNLIEVTFAEPATITSTGNNSFMNCSSLTTLVFPDGMLTLGSSFAGCTALADVTIPASVTSIHDQLATLNPNMTIHCYKDSFAQTWAAEKGLKLDIIDGGDALIYDGINARIAAAEKVLGEDAAYYTKDSLAALQTELDAAKSVKETATEQGQIDGAADALDAKIKALVFMPFQYAVGDNNEVTVIGFNDNRSDIGVPSMDVVIPETIDGMPVTAIGAGAFESKLIKTVSIPVGIKTIGDNAFKSCASLTGVTFAGGGLTAIGDGAFQSCQKLAAITLPETLETIGVNAFLGARVLKTLTIPAAVTAIGNGAIGSCFELTDVYVLNNDVVYGGANVFSNSSKVILHAASDSTTEAYAIANELNFVSTTIIKYQYVLGDVDGNGEVNIADVLKIQNWLAKQIELENKALLAADVDANVKVEVADVLNIQKYKALMPVEFEIGETLEIDEADIPDYPAPPEIPTEPSSEATLPTEPPTQPDTEAPTTPEGQIPLYVSNAVSWITDDGCKLWAYNVDTQEFVAMEINLEGTYFSANVDESWQNIAFYRSTYDIDEATFSIDLPVEQMPNKWTGLPARGDNNCFLVTADSAGKWQVYDPDAPVQDTKTVYFDNSVTQWDTVYVYGWSFGLKNEFVEMEKVTDDIYKYTFPVAPTPGVNGFLFVNAAAWGGQQTVDCAVEEGKNLYTNLSGSGTSWTGTWDVYGAD